MAKTFWLLLPMIASQAFAQFSGAIQGNVIDSTNAVVPAAVVTVTDSATGISREVPTSGEGFYRVSNLAPGKYEIRVEKPGFAVARTQGLVVGIGDIARADFTLAVGNVAEQIRVEAVAPLLETEQGRVSDRVDRQQLTQMPLNGRNVFNLLALQAGMVGRGLSVGFGGGGGGNQGSLPINDSYAGESGPQVHASGQRWEANNYTVDDTSTNGNARQGVTTVTPNAEAVEEVRVTTNNFSAVDGRTPGAQIQTITKGGTNEFHGTASWYHNDNVLSSRNIFESKVAVMRKNLFGYSFGGPIKRNRTFFFTTYEGLRQSGNRAVTFTVETPEFRDFVLRTRPNSIAAKLLRDFGPVTNPTRGFRDLGSPAAGVNRIGAVDGIMDVGLVDIVPGSFRNGDQFTLRMDHELRPGKDRIYGTYMRTTNTNQVGTGSGSTAGGARASFNRPTDEKMYFGNLNFTHTFSPTIVNEFRAGVNQLIGRPPAQDHLEVPNISIAGGLAGFGGGNYPLGWWQTNYDIKDVFTIVRSRHTLKAGFTLRLPRSGAENTNNYIPTYSFNSLLDFADDEALQEVRQVNPYTGLPVLTYTYNKSKEWALFINDDWKVTRNFTVNVGLRYENFGSFRDKPHRQMSTFVFGEGNSVPERLANGRMQIVDELYPTDNLNFGPRFGFAYDVTGKGKTVIRGGWGLAYDRQGSGGNNDPYRVTVTLGSLFGTDFIYSLGDPTKPFLGYPVEAALRTGVDSRGGLVGARIAVTAKDQGSSNTPYTYNWFLGVQREIAKNTMVELNYSAHSAPRLVYSNNINRYTGDLLDNRFDGFNPSFSTVTISDTNGKSNYHGATLTLRRAFTRGFSLQGSYNYGKAITDTQTPQNAWDRRSERALAPYDARHKLSSVGLWEMPLLRGKGWMSSAFGGWQLSGFLIIQSGNPITITRGGSYPTGDFNADNSGGDRPNAPIVDLKRGGWSRQELLNGVFQVADFPRPAAGTNGNLGRSTFTGANFAEVDLSLAKKFVLHERLSAQLRLESFNALNRPNLSDPTTDLNNATFGRATGAYTPRLFQLGLRFQF